MVVGLLFCGLLSSDSLNQFISRGKEDFILISILIVILMIITSISLILYLNSTKKKNQQLQILLKEIEDKSKTLDTLFRYSPVGILISDSKGKILSFNDEFAKLFGIEQGLDIVGRSIFDFLSPKAFEKCKDAINKIDNGIAKVINEFDVTLPNGEVRNLRHICSAFENEYYGFDTFAHIFVDLTEIKAYQNLLKKNEEKYRTYIELSSDAIWCFEGIQPLPTNLPVEKQIELIFKVAYLADCNLAFARFYGFDSVESAKGTPFSKLISPDNPTKVELLRQFITNNYSVDGFITVVQDEKGNDIYVRNSLFGVVENGFVVRVWGAFQNITELINLQRKYQQTARQYENLLENVNSIILHMDLSGRILYMNQFGLDFFGYTREELIGQNVVGTIVPKIETHSGRDLEELIKDLLNNPKKYEQNENENLKKDGTRVWISWKNAPIFDEQGKVVAVLSAGIDVTERRQKEEELKQAWNFIYSMMEALPDGVAIKDPEGRWVYANRAMLEVFDLVGKEEIGKTDLELARYNEFYREELEDCYKTDNVAWEKREPIRSEESVKTKDGDVKIFDVIKVPGFNLDGSRRGLAVVARDITVQKNAEKALKISDERYREIVQNFPLPSFVVHRDNIVFSNELAKTTFEKIFKSEPVLFSNLKEYFDFEELAKIFNAMQLPERTTQSTKINSFANERIYLVSTVPIVFGMLESYLIVFFDITGQAKYQEYLENLQKKLIYKSKELERINRELNEKNRELAELNATKDRFFSIIAHDLKNPIYGIKSLSEEFIRSFDDLRKEEMREFVFAMQSSAAKLAELLEELLIWARTQTKTLQLNPVELNLRYVVDSTISLFQTTAQQKNIVLLSRVDDSAVVFADTNCLSTILANLISNSIKFTNEGGVVRIFSKTIEENGKLFEQISVQDNGIGIPYEVQDKLLQLDFVYTSPGTKKETGTGLGLNIVQELVKISVGRLWFESTPNVGSIFHFTLPKERFTKL